MPKGVDGNFVYHMEDVLDLYAQPLDPERPVVCFDECSKELHGQVAEPIPPQPAVPATVASATEPAQPAKDGQPAKEDYEYVRHGTANLFIVINPLAGERHVTVTKRRTKVDFAEQMRVLCEELDPEAKRIRVVLDNLNTHAMGSLFETFGPVKAWELAKRLEFHFTPKHASWLNMAEMELSVLARQCLNRRIEDRDVLAKEIAAWQEKRNEAEVKIDWCFRVADARKKLDHLYPKQLPR